MYFFIALNLLGCRSKQDSLATIIDREIIEETIEEGIFLTGRVFYNDLRTYGRFEYHLDRDGNFGEQCSYHFKDCRQNYLSATMAGVQLLENDVVIDETAIQMDGSYSFWVESPIAVSLRFLLRQCNDVLCYSFQDDRGDLYSLIHPDASLSAPLQLGQRTSYDLPDAIFQPQNVADGESDNHPHAINHFMGLTEVIYDWSIDAAVPFDQEAFGELVVTMPAVIDTVGQTRNYDDIQMPENKKTWVRGQKIAHEYGHVLQMRSWEGQYWFDSPRPSWSAKSKQRNEIAFKEGWANFIPRASFSNMACQKKFDLNESWVLVGTVEEGHLYPRNVTKFLCDLYDEDDEDDIEIEGLGDQLAIADLAVFRQAMVEMLAQSTIEERESGLGLCDFIDAVLASQPDDLEKMISTMQNNQISCGLY